MSALQRKTGLGKGLSALLQDSDDLVKSPATTPAIESVKEKERYPGIGEIPIDQISINPYQPRTEFEAESLQELADSIHLQGLIQPITVRQLEPGRYQLISGERRLRASKLAGKTQIPAYIRRANDQQMLEMALIENIQRENLNAIEVALSFQRMIDECHLKQEELGERVSKNRSTVTNYLRLLRLPPAIQLAIRDGQISMGHAKALITVGEIDKQLFLFRQIVEQDLSVRKTEALVRSLQQEQTAISKKPKAVNLPFQYKKVEDDLASKFSSRVRLKLNNNKGKGNIEIPFESEDDLNRILELLDW
jgi:ParB family chromosome partitioning protein